MVNMTSIKLENGNGSLKSGGTKGSKANSVDPKGRKIAFILEKTKSSANSLLMDTQGKCAIDTLKNDKQDKAYQVRLIWTDLSRMSHDHVVHIG